MPCLIMSLRTDLNCDSTGVEGQLHAMVLVLADEIAMRRQSIRVKLEPFEDRYDELLLARDASYDSHLVVDAAQHLRLNEVVHRLDDSGHDFAGRPIEEELDEFAADQIGERLKDIFGFLGIGQRELAAIDRSDN
jgi:hypothetical protein